MDNKEIKIKNILEGAFNSLLKSINLLPKELSIIANNRAEVCKSCELCYFDDNLKILRCGVCKCYISWKVNSKTEKCPKGKW